MLHFHRAAAQQDFSGKTGVIRGDGQGSAASLLQLGASRQGTGSRPRVVGGLRIDDDQARIHLSGDVHGLRRIAGDVSKDDSVAVGKGQARIPGGIPRSPHRPRIVSAARPGQGRDLLHNEFQGIVRRAPVADVVGPQQNGIGQVPGDAARGIDQIVRARAPAHAVAILQQQTAVHRQGAVQGQHGVAVHRHVGGVNPHGRAQVQVAGHRILPPKGQDAGGHGQAGTAVHGGDVQAHSRGQGKPAVSRGNAPDDRIPRYGKVLVRPHPGGMTDNEGAPFQLYAAREGRGFGQGQRSGAVLDQQPGSTEYIVTVRNHVPGPGNGQSAVQLDIMSVISRNCHGAGGIHHLHGAAARRDRQAVAEGSVSFLGNLQAPVVQGPVTRIDGHGAQPRTVIRKFSHAQHAAVGDGYIVARVIIPLHAEAGSRRAQIQRGVVNGQGLVGRIGRGSCLLRRCRFNLEHAAAGNGEAVASDVERPFRLGNRLSGLNSQRQAIGADGRSFIPRNVRIKRLVGRNGEGIRLNGCGQRGAAGKKSGQQIEGQMQLHKEKQLIINTLNKTWSFSRDETCY